MRNVRFLLILALAIMCVCSRALAEENMIQNPDFARLDASGAPEGWYAEAWVTGNTQFDVVTLPGGETAGRVYSFLENDARWVQEIAVKPNTTYVIRCRAMAEDCDKASQGANISILNTFVYSESVFETNGEWTDIELYGVTASKQNVIQLAARVGGYGTTGAGTAWFTDFFMSEADAPPGTVALSLATNEPYSPPPAQADGERPERMTETILLMAFGFLLAGMAAISCARRLKAREKSLTAPAEGGARPACYLGLILFISLIVRVYVGGRVYGYSIDINDFMIWGESFYKDGAGFYANTSFCDYPPLYMALLGALSAVRRVLGIAYGSQAHVILVKFVPMLCDLAFAIMVYRLFAEKAGWKLALILSAVIAFNPAYISDSAAWGQVDSVLALLIAMCLYYATRGKWHIALPLFAVSMLTKPQALLFGPIGLIALCADAWRCREDKRALKRMLMGLVLALAAAYIIAAPFSMYETITGSGESGILRVIVSPVLWLVELFSGTFSGYKCLSINACNLYVLLDMNWREMASEPGITALAWALFALSYAYTGYLCIASKSRRSLPLAGAVLMCLLFAFAPMMHERYLFPAIALLILAYIEYRDWRLLALTLVLSLTQFINLALVLQGGTIAKYASDGHLQYTEQALNAAVSLVNVLAAIFLAWTAFDILRLGNARQLPEAAQLPYTPLERLKRRSDYRLRLRPRDWALMAGVTAVYSVCAFVNLGSTKAPQSFWTNTEYKETVVFDLGEEREFRMTYYGGISSATFSVALSNDGENWTEENLAVYDAGEIFRWLWYVPSTLEGGKFADASESDVERIDTGEGGARVEYATVNSPYPLQSARYVRLTAMGMGLTLGEFGFWDVSKGELLPIAGVSGSSDNANYAYLTDEQHAVAQTPSYYNGSYFDEIYHARTAYEFIEGMNILEWSHPHLGKILIMAGIRIFGMTPFGWRFMGALVGVLMLPVMYLLIKQLTKKSDLAFLGMFLLSVDSMHFTQTRIATVDSYAVFFIMLMYLFMFRYCQMNMNRDPLPKTLWPLGLSGLCMGLACASKWTGIYAGAGLAVLFFTSVFMRYREYRALKASGLGSADEFPRRITITLIFCVAAFIVIPIMIYYFSYYWHMAPSGGLSLEKVWDMQKQMLGYHKGLGDDTHRFRSPWFEWPLIIEPMWYYSSDIAYLGRGVVSSISCMGNPAVWWTGLAALLALLCMLTCKTKPRASFYCVAVAFAAQFLPWVLVPRSTFIYHYFASVPFIIIAIALMLNEVRRLDKYAAYTAGAVLMALSLALFIAFYPLESGYPCAYEYALRLKWFNWYNFALQ